MRKKIDKLQDWEKCECGKKATKRIFELDENCELNLHAFCSECYEGENNQIIRTNPVTK